MITEKPRLPIRAMLLVGLWPSPIKKLIYRLKGYRIGRGVRLGLGSVIIGEDVEIGDYARIGFLTSIRGKTLRIGPHVQVGAMTLMETPHIELGEGTKINEQVFVGGLQFPDSRLVVGRNCQIMQMTFINPCRSITIGDDTGIGGDCLLFGHSSWLSRFEGYPVDFESIHIGSNVSLAWRVFVLPGTKIGDGVVVGANSLVKGTIPPRCLAVGFPARVMAKEPYFPRRVGDEEKRVFLKEIMDEFAAHLSAHGCRVEREDSIMDVYVPGRGLLGGGTHGRLRVVSEPGRAVEDVAAQSDDVYLSLYSIPAATRDQLTRKGAVWVDIESKERPDHGNELGEELIQYLKRYGVRLFRVRPGN